jgi:hypothetical protein
MESTFCVILLWLLIRFNKVFQNLQVRYAFKQVLICFNKTLKVSI